MQAIQIPLRSILLILVVFITIGSSAQQGDQVYHENIASVKLHVFGDPYTYPVLRLNGNDLLQLYFDDLDGGVKNYSYMFQLCNADWTPSNLHPLDYTRGFQQVRIMTYRNSSIAFARYTNYQANIPDRNSVPTKSGNYLLKVFLDGDTSKLAFTKRFLVYENRASIATQVLQPFNGSIFRSHQKLQVAVNTQPEVNVFNQQDIKVVLLQNYAWNTARYLDRPTIYRGNYFEYQDEERTSFPAGKEWRWIDLRTLRLLSDRMHRLDKQPTRTDVFVKPDMDRQNQVYIYYRDLNGLFTLENTDGNNPFWQSDYAWVHFSFVPPGNKELAGREIFLYGELTGYGLHPGSRLAFNPEKGIYELSLYLKQGYYNYNYVTRSTGREGEFSYENTEGNHWGTENLYTVLVYYRPFGGRYDQLIGFTQTRTGF